MKPLKNTDYEVSSNISGEEIALDFDPAARVHLMNVMTDLYSDRPMAVLREYSTNAYDAHIEAGVTEPIQVTLPNRLEPTLRIRDFGSGLDLDQVRHVYSKYGASTKRDTNDQVGSFGLGCKSALTYSNQFSVTSVKAGLKHRMTIHRDPDGASSVTVLTDDGEPTDDRSGVEISVPAKRWDTFETQARDLFRFWPEDTVLVNGEKPKRIDGLWLSDTLVLADTDSYATSFVVMGNVPYPIEFENLEFKDGYSLVAFVPIGTVSPMYNRESLHMTPETKATIEKVEKEFGERVATQVQKEVDKAKTAWEAIRIAQHWHTIVPAHARANEYFWNGKKMPSEFELKQDDTTTKIYGVPSHHYAHRLKQHTRERVIPVESFPHTIFVTHYDRPGFTPYQKKKLNKWAADNDFSDNDWREKDPNKLFRRFMLLPGPVPKAIRSWIDPKRIVKWEKVNAIKLPRTTSSKYGGGHPLEGRIPGSYDVWIDGQMNEEYAADDIDQSQPVFYFTNHRSGYNFAQIIAHKWPEATVVTFYQNRLSKFLRNFPNARPARDGAVEVFEEWKQTLSKSNRYALYLTHELNGNVRTLLERINPERIADPKLRITARLVRRDCSALLETHQKFSNGLGRSTVAFDFSDIKWSDPLKPYSLIQPHKYYYNPVDIMRNAPDHVYTYLNAAYEAGLTKKGQS